MIYLGFPVGSNFGWGVLGKETALAMSELADVCVLPQHNDKQRIVDEFDLYRVRKLLAAPSKHGRRVGDLWQMNGPIIQIAQSPNLDPIIDLFVLPAAVGYAVFENNILPPDMVRDVRKRYLHLAAGSTYCADVLRQHGFENVSTVLHGVDSTLFCPRPERRSFLPDRFVVFSGGKFELRKSQDIVIRAYKVLQDRHTDVMLVNSWYNNWECYRDTMAQSSLIKYAPAKSQNHGAWIHNLLTANGIDVSRVVTILSRPQSMLPDVYHNTDVGLFPNRVEGGNNMVLMEYLACGKPTIVSYNSGHTDIVHRDNAVLIEDHKPMAIHGADKELSAVWNDPSLEETIAKLEWCYQNRDKLAPLAKRAATDMRQLSWKRVAEGLLEALRRTESANGVHMAGPKPGSFSADGQSRREVAKRLQ